MHHIQQEVDRLEALCAILVERIESTAAYQRFERPPREALSCHAFCKVEEVSEFSAARALADHLFHDLSAYMLERAEPVANGILPLVLFQCELDARTIHIRRQKSDAHSQQTRHILRETIGVLCIEDHHRDEKGGGMMNAQPRRLIGDHRIGGGVRLVEAVACKGVDLFKDLAGDALLHTAFGTTLEESFSLPAHLDRVLLAHRASETVGRSQREARQHLRHADHLLLIDGNAVGLAQNRLQLLVQIDDRFSRMLARDIAGNMLHRPWAVERDRRDDVLEAIRTHAPQHLADARRFELEDSESLGAREKIEHCRRIQRQPLHVQLCSTLFQQSFAVRDHAERLQP